MGCTTYQDHLELMLRSYRNLSDSGEIIHRGFRNEQLLENHWDKLESLIEQLGEELESFEESWNRMD